MCDKIYFPDEIDSAKKNLAELAESKVTDNNSFEDPPEQLDGTDENSPVWKSETIVAENLVDQRVIFPDELQDIKNLVSENIEQGIQEDHDAEATNMIVAPPNCPKGQQMGADGVCRDVF